MDDGVISAKGVDVPKTHMRHVRPLRGRFTHERVDAMLKSICDEDTYEEMKLSLIHI